MIPVAPPPRKSTWFHVAASFCFVVATAASVIALFIVNFAMSYCGDEAPAENEPTLRIATAVIGALWTAVPGLIAGLATTRHREYQPWLRVAGCAAALTFYAALTAQPNHFCVF